MLLHSLFSSEILFCLPSHCYHLLAPVRMQKHSLKYKQLFEYEHLLRETSGGQSSNLYLNAVHFFNTSAN
jgi:hypothetical protein